MTGRRPIAHVVFDVGMVLIHWNPELAYLESIPDDRDRCHFLSNICSPDWNREQDRGRDWQTAEERLISEHPEWASHIRAYRANWHRMVPHAIEENVAVLRHFLASDVDVTLLTNFAADTFSEAAERFAFLGQTRGVTVSARVALLKPDREIYEHHAATFGLTPGATLFIDDSKANIEGAIAAGWQGLHYRDPVQLRASLAKLGLLSSTQIT